MSAPQIWSAVEYVALGLTVALALARIGLYVWAYLDHGHPDARREWVQRAVELAVLATGQAESLIGVGAGTPVEEKTCQDLGRRAETYLADHGLHLHLDPETIRLVLNELRDYQSGGLGFQHPTHVGTTPAGYQPGYQPKGATPDLSKLTPPQTPSVVVPPPK